MPRYYDMDKLAEMLRAKADTLIEGKEAFLYVAKWLDLLPAADVAREIFERLHAHRKTEGQITSVWLDDLICIAKEYGVDLEKKVFTCENGRRYLFPARHCAFCKHCTDIFYDYTHGPYMFICDLGKDDFRTCGKFEEEKEEE